MTTTEELRRFAIINKFLEDSALRLNGHGTGYTTVEVTEFGEVKQTAARWTEIYTQEDDSGPSPDETFEFLRRRSSRPRQS